ncbi:LAME_0C08680g1_1 [Lachancea meyersii CBS 8951]|uniref:LAME_0C08680g1_1 n=1 Tax=Lachancea meyersii CBS 8951 TaxID=1266667 RepID=A0A1G4J3C2_9SACH|nr:LAME_0C08680g1_1 [Lachancea meyersii CBS 8951]
MFGSNNGSSTLFGGGLNTSTPTSKVVSTDSTFQPRQKTATGGLFGASNIGASNGTSTPSPSGGLFGNNSNSGNTQSSISTFGGAKNPSSLSTGLFGNSTMGKDSNPTSGGLFGTSAAQKGPGFSGGGLFSQQKSTPTNYNNVGSSLFGNSANTSSTSGGLFGGSTADNNFDQRNQNPGSNLSNGGVLNGNFGGLLKNRPNTGGFGSASAGTSAGSLFSTASSQPSQNVGSASANPYGLQFSNIAASSGARMPESITSNASKLEPSSHAISVIDKPQSSGASPQNSAAAFSNLKNNTSLIGKLSSRLKTARRAQPTQGLFSPARKSILRQEFSHASDEEIKTSQSIPYQTSADVSAQNTPNTSSNLRKLKIDTNRSAAKKVKLFNGTSEATLMKVLGEKRSCSGKDAIVLETKHKDELDSKVASEMKSDEETNETSRDHGYWCSPPIQQLTKLPIKQLCSVPNFVIGRKGYGSISFDNDVDLSSLVDDLENNLFGKVVIFHKNRTVEVYPEHTSKPSFGYGLNVPATITLEKVSALDKSTKMPIKDYNATEVQVLIKRLKMQKGMAFISYNPTGGLWTFKVQHFSIWGLVDESEMDQVEDENPRLSERKVAFPKHMLPPKKTPTELSLQNTEKHSLASLTDLSESRDILQSLEPHNATMSDLIDEKQYEPSDVGAKDLIYMEDQSELSVSDDWVSQLKLAGESPNSVFAFSKKQESNDNALFPSLEANLKIRKRVRKEMRVFEPVPFAKFSFGSRLLVPSLKDTSGCALRLVAKSQSKVVTKISRTFEECFPCANIEARLANGYPLVQSWSVTIEKLGQSMNIEDEVTLWSMISILFDEPDYGVNDGDHNETRRYKKLCDWVVHRIKASHSTDLEATEDPFVLLFYSLIVGDVIGATKLAIKTGNSHLASLISLLTVHNPNVQYLAHEQLRLWRSLNRKVEPFIIKIYQLLAGDIFENEALINFFKEHTWMECLAIHLLYGNMESLPLRDAISKFFQYPSYDKKSKFESVVFRILKFYSSKVRDEKLLESTQISRDPFQSHNTWFLLQALRFKNDCHFSDEKMDKVTLHFFEQLVSTGLYLEALFCLFFLNSDELAKRQIDTLICEHVSFFSQGSARRVLENFKVPPSVIFNALALYSKYTGDFFAEAENLLEGGLADAAAECVVTKVGPELVLKSSRDKRRLDTLRGILEKILKQHITAPQSYLLLLTDYTRFILDRDADLAIMERIMKTLPAYYSECGKSEMVSICCSIMSSNVALSYLDNHVNKANITETRERILTLPMGEPELQFMKRKIDCKSI